MSQATAVMSSLLSMTPQQATLAETGETVNVKDVKIDTLVAVKAGELIPIDGIVVEGTCEVDEKTLTGESYPVPKHKDSTVWAGTVNVNGNYLILYVLSSSFFTNFFLINHNKPLYNAFEWFPHRWGLGVSSVRNLPL